MFLCSIYVCGFFTFYGTPTTLMSMKNKRRKVMDIEETDIVILNEIIVLTNF